MKIRRSIYGVVIVVVVFLALLLWHGNKKPATNLLARMPSSASHKTNVLGVATKQNNPAATSRPASAKTPIAQATQRQSISPPPMESKGEQMREGLAKLNNEDIFLYGRVIDQFSNAVANATITASIQVNNGTRVGTENFSLITDNSGYFTISGYKGKALGIWVKKEGYVMATTNTYFIYSLLWPKSQRYTPDPNHPTIIKMWKLEGAEPLVSINKTFKIRYTKAPIHFDLVTRKITPTGGDISITVNRPTGEVSERNPQKWGIDFEVVNGGFIKTSGRESSVTFAAPQKGYEPSGVFINNNGTDGLDEAFFIKSRNGQVFSKLYLSMGINNKPDGFFYVTLRGVANTNGSGNWEATAPQQ